MFESESGRVILDHVVATMPDSICGRIKVLTALQVLLTEAHPAYRRIGSMLIILELAEKQQSELPLHFTPSPAPTPGGAK